MEGYRRLDPKSKASMYMGNAILMAAFLLAVSGTVYFGWDTLTDKVAEDVLWAAVIMSAAAVAAYLIAEPMVFYNRYRYRIDAERIDVRRGVLVIRHTTVPIERVHQVEVRRGPINNMLGLANVEVTTAGGAATIEYLDLKEAEEIAERLNALINRIVKGLRDADR